MKEENNNYYKQAKMFNPYKDGQPKIHIYGAGSIGSWTTLCLAKMGFSEITLYDYDIIEEDNIPAQFHKSEDAENKLMKTIALSKSIDEFANIQINFKNKKIDTLSELDLSSNSIHILAFDNIEGRNIIFEKLRGFNVILIDGRIGGFQQEIYYLDCKDEYSCERYAETLKGEFSEQECGLKTLCANNMIIAGRISMSVLKNIKKDEKNNFCEITDVREMSMTIKRR